MNTLHLILSQLPIALDNAQAQPSIGQSILSLVLSPAGIGTLGALIATVLGAVVGTNEVRRRRVALGVYHAFHIVEDIGKEIPGDDAFDKVAIGLAKVDEFCRANGWRPLQPNEQEIAKLQFSALNGASKLAEKVAAAALAPKADDAPKSTP